MKPKTAKKLTSHHVGEIASAPRTTWRGFPDAERISQHIVRSEGFAEATASSWGRGVYGLFDDMEDKDPHFFSLLQTRKHGVLARPRMVEPASDGDADAEIARWLQRSLKNLRNWDEALMHLLDSLAKGMAVLEIIWGFDAEDRVVPLDLKPRGADRFSFDSKGSLKLDERDSARLDYLERNGVSGDDNRQSRRVRSLDLGSRNLGMGPPGTAERLTEGRLPERKFLVMLFGANDERPYGRGLAERVYWYWWFKKTNLKFWVMFNEKFGAPTVVAHHAPGLSAEERERLLEVISSVQSDAGVTLPEGIKLDLLESHRRGSADTYRDLANWCNDQMTRAVLGQTLTVDEGRRSGSLAQARVHEAVRVDYLRTDACRLMDIINHQLVRWMIDFNFGEDFPAPHWKIDLTPEIDAETEVKIDRQLLQMGVPLPLRYFHEKYGRPAAVEGERGLRYDDSNLFQYHLRFGVLTINEVRASLGLPPVEWGDRPTSPVDAQPAPPIPEASTGDASLQGGLEKESESEEEKENEESAE